MRSDNISWSHVFYRFGGNLFVRFLRVTFLVPVLLSFTFPSLFAQSSLSFSTDNTLLYHEKSSRQAWDIWFTESKLNAGFQIRKIPVSLTLVHQTDYLSFSNFQQNQTFTLENKSELFSTELTFQWDRFKIQPSGSLTFGNNSTKPGAALLLTVDINPSFSVFGETKFRHRAYSHTWQVDDSKPEFSQWAAITEFKGGFLWHLNSVSVLSGWFQHGKSKISGHNQTFREQGSYQNQEGEFSFRSCLAESWFIQSDGRFYSGQGQPEWLYKNFPFSGIESGKVTSHLFNAGLTKDLTPNWNLGGGVTYREMSLQSGGLLQSFPFTPAVIALIGDYYFFSIDGIIRIPGLNLETTYKADNWGSARFSIGWQRARPKSKIQTWEPLFFLIGRKNERNTPFSYQYADIIPLQIDISWNVNGVIIGLDASQLIPVHAVKKAAKTSGGSGSGAPVKSNSGKTVWGGTEVKLSALYTF